MELSALLAHVDHTLLSPSALPEEIETVCREAAEYHTASVCISPRWVPLAVCTVSGLVPVCTVIGFPLGTSTTACKAFEAREALALGAGEIDMVISVGDLKAGRNDAVLAELKALREICSGAILKVIVETCLLTEAEKCRICGLVAKSGADYIKTSTGFSNGGATFDDIKLFSRELKGTTVKIKASGGIRTLEDMERFLLLGADRLGCSAAIRLAKSTMENKKGSPGK